MERVAGLGLSFVRRARWFATEGRLSEPCVQYHWTGEKNFNSVEDRNLQVTAAHADAFKCLFFSTGTTFRTLIVAFLTVQMIPSSLQICVSLWNHELQAHWNRNGEYLGPFIGKWYTTTDRCRLLRTGHLHLPEFPLRKGLRARGEGVHPNH